LSREQQATLEFMSVSQFLRNVADDGRGRGLLEFTEALTHAVSSFGVSELYARQGERHRALGNQSDSGEHPAEERGGHYEDHYDGHWWRKSRRYNDKGLRTLSYARDTLRQFREDLSNYPTEEYVLGSDVDQFQDNLRENLADLDLKPSDVEKIDEVFGQGLEVVRSQGAAGLPDYFEEQVSYLERLRRQRDRGAVENIPVWKVAAIAVAVGVWVWALFRCRWWGSCSLKEGLAYFTVFWIAALIARFC